jgi:hypothetical protein
MLHIQEQQSFFNLKKVTYKQIGQAAYMCCFLPQCLAIVEVIFFINALWDNVCIKSNYPLA